MNTRTRICAALLACAASSFAQTGKNSYIQTILASSIPGLAPITDPNLLDPWGISFSTTSPFWTSNHLSGTSTLYNGSGVITPTVVAIPPGAASGKVLGRPTGQVQNFTANFILPVGTKASFIFSTEDGTISGWNAGTTAITMADNSAQGAVYKGLAIGTSALGSTLYAPNFRSGNIDVFDGNFKPATVAGGFKDAGVPAGFAPFNIWTVNGFLYVAYAKQDANKYFDVVGAGNGYVSQFDFDGNLKSHLVSGGALNSPWGLAMAPATWGAFGGALLVGNFGDGKINAFDAKTGALLGALQNADGAPLQIGGLWAIAFGNGGRGGDVNTLYFLAGNPSPTNGVTVANPRGLLGSIAPPAAVTSVLNAASFTGGTVAPGEIVTIIGQTVGVTPSVAAVIPTSGFLPTSLLEPGTTYSTSVTVNGIPAPILYANGNQTSVQVPYAVRGSANANFIVTTAGQATPAFAVPVAATAPGLFTSDTTGKGQIVALNQDGTLNTAKTPAAKGSYVILYATGEGAENPGALDGAIQSGFVRVPFAPINVTIGGTTAPVVFAGTLPGSVSGILLVEAVVPASAPTGLVPITLSAGSATSPVGSVISVQ